MTSIAELGIRVDSGDAASAATDLDKLVEAGGRAEKAAAGVEQSAKKAGQALRGQADDLGQLLGEIDPTVKALGRLDELENRLAKQKNFLDPEIFTEYQGKIQQSRESLTRFDDSLTRTGNTAKQNAAALRGVPAQFTDIFTSIVAGQPIMMVALQQGGQLKDMFGGIGPAARALGGYILGLVNPFTVAAAAVGVLGYAYYKGSEEAVEYQKALITTGNAAGTTSDRLSGMAREVSATVGTTGAAAEVLTQLAGSGKVAAGSFVEITEAALDWRSATGRAVEETVAEFVKIGKDPVVAAKDLNEQYNFLTASTYSQIVALKEQGDTIGAAKLLTDTYADTIKERSGQITENLGLIEKAWKGIKAAAAGALDATYNVGREVTLAQQIEALERKLADPQSYSAIPIIGEDNPNLMERSTTREEDENRLRTLQLYRKEQEGIAKSKADEARSQQAAIVATDKVDALEKAAWTNAEKRAEKLKEYHKSLNAIRLKNPEDERLKPERIARVEADIAKQFKDPAGRTSPVDLSGFNDQKNALNAILAEYKNYQKELDAAQKAGLISQESYAAQRAAIVEQQKAEVTNAYEAEIKALEDAKARSSTSAQQRIQLDQKIADARAAMVKAQKDADTELSVLATNEQGRLAKQERAITSYVQALEQQQRALELAGQRAVVGVGRGDRQNALNGELNTQQDRYAQQVLDLENQRSDPSRNMSEAEFERKSQALASANKKATDQIQQNYADVEAAQGDWTKGASAAWENYLDGAKNIAGQTKTLFGNAFSSMEDSIVNFAMTGKASFADFAKSIIADMARIAARQAASGLLGGLVNLGVSAASAYFGGGSGNGMEAGSAGAVSSNLGASQAGYGSAYFPQALGGAWSQGVQMFADGGAFTNSIVSKPTAFGMAGGRMGVMGEAGDEAVMPLTRTAGGQLGVRAVGGGGGTSISMPMSLTLVTEDRSGEGMQLDQQALQQNMQAQMKAAGEKAVADSWRPGGISYRNSQGRR